MINFNRIAAKAAIYIIGFASLMSAPNVMAQTVKTLGDGASSGGSKMIIFDASGSMWGQIDGTSKLVIAKDVVKDTIAKLPENSSIGLMAYGHRTKGDCQDIEVLAEPMSGASNKAFINEAVDNLSAKGKTPLSAAVLQAAQILRYEEDKATVILLSDGKETCDLDPCQVATELGAAGVDFTAHVVGFDIAEPEEIAQLQCLADNTGGQFFSANDADELADALEKVSVADVIFPDESDFQDAEILPEIYFEDDFDGVEIADHWEIENRSDDLFHVQDSQVIMVAVNERHEFWEERALNRFRLNHDLPDGDFDLVLSFKWMPQTGVDEMSIGLTDGFNDQIVASLFNERGGCGDKPILYLTQVQPDGDRTKNTEFRLDIFDDMQLWQFCEPGSEVPAMIVDHLASEGIDLVLEKRGRTYAARFDANFPAYEDQEVTFRSFTTPTMTRLKMPTSASMMVGQRGGPQGETIVMIDRISILEK